MPIGVLRCKILCIKKRNVKEKECWSFLMPCVNGRDDEKEQGFASAVVTSSRWCFVYTDIFQGLASHEQSVLSRSYTAAIGLGTPSRLIVWTRIENTPHSSSCERGTTNICIRRIYRRLKREMKRRHEPYRRPGYDGTS